MNKKKVSSPLIRVRSKINQDVYFTSKDFPTKEIDGQVFIGVRKNANDKQIFFMKKENMEKA